MRGWLIPTLTAVIVLLVLFMAGCAPREQRYGLLNCKPDVRTCLVFNTATGDIEPRTLPSLPSTGEQEVRK